MQVPFPVKVQNGDIVKLHPGEKPEVYDKAPVGRLYVDGNISVNEDSESIKDRKNLAINGYLEVTILINKKGKILKKPILSYKGLPIIHQDDFLSDLDNEIQNTTRTFSINNKKQENNLVESLRINCRKIAKEKTGKKPYTNINLVKI